MATIALPPRTPDIDKSIAEIVRKAATESPHVANVAVGHPAQTLVPGNIDALVQFVEFVWPFIYDYLTKHGTTPTPTPAPQFLGSSPSPAVEYAPVDDGHRADKSEGDRS